MNFFKWIYELFYYDLLSGDELPSQYLMHEISLLLTFISIFLLFLGSIEVFKWILALAKIRRPKWQN